MKFFYALILYIITTGFFFWLMLFILPTPRLIPIESETSSSERAGILGSFYSTLKEVSFEDKPELYKFEENLDQKREGSLIVYFVFSFVFIVISVIAFHKKSHLVLPISASIISALAMCILLWVFNNSFGLSLYLDLQTIIDKYRGLEALKFLGLFIALDVFMIIFGYWYQIPD